MNNCNHYEELVARLKQGDYTAFDEIYRQYSKPLYLFLKNRLNDYDLSSDTLQDIFISLWEKRAVLDITTSLKAYLFQTARYKIIDIYRKDLKYKQYLADLAAYLDSATYIPQESVDTRRKLGAVMESINHLPLRMKEIFILSRFEQLSIDSIAQQLALSPQTVKNQLTKALRILRSSHSNTDLIIITTTLLLSQAAKG